MISACGLAAYGMFPRLSLNTCAILHSLAAFAIALKGEYIWFESIIKFFVGVMFVTIVGSALCVWTGAVPVRKSLIPKVPQVSGKFLLGVVGGVGGTLTLLSYGYTD